MPHIWLAYVSYPVTTAAYLERALRKICRVTTVGPRLPQGNIALWSLENMKLPILPLDIETDREPDMQALWEECPPEDRPDMYLWVESVFGYFPRNISALPCKKVCYLIDMHLNLNLYLDFARQFDYAFIVHRQFVPNVREVVPNSHWLPVACDPEIHQPSGKPKRYDVSFVGSIADGTRRAYLLEQLKQQVPLHIERCFWDEMAMLFSESRIVFNNCVSNDLNMRFFEVLSTGSLLLSDMALDSGQEELFVAGEDYVLYRDDNPGDVARYYLDNETARETIAARGKRLAHAAHTYDDRVRDMLDVVLRKKQDTMSAVELREKSLRGLVRKDTAPASEAVCSSAQDLIGRLVTDGNPDAALRICNILLEVFPGNGTLASLAKFCGMLSVKSGLN